MALFVTFLPVIYLFRIKRLISVVPIVPSPSVIFSVDIAENENSFIYISLRIESNKWRVMVQPKDVFVSYIIKR